MTKTRRLSAQLSTYLAVALAVGIAVHLAWSLLLAAVLSARFQHRIFNTRNVEMPAAAHAGLFSAFVHDRIAASDKPAVGFFGSSFTYGYLWPENRTFSYLFARRRTDLNVFNAGRIGADTDSAVADGICPIIAAHETVAAAFVEIPIVNSLGNFESRLRQKLPLQGYRFPDVCRSGHDDRRFFDTFVRHPYGLGWLPVLWDEEAYEKPERPLSIAPLPVTYFGTKDEFDAVLPAYREWLPATVSGIRAAATRIYLFPSPIYLAGVAEAGGDPQLVEQQFRATLAICRSIEGVTCLDTSEFLNHREFFANLTHLNLEGHRAFAEFLLEQYGKSEHASDARD
jgi:hypothetical protein